MSNTTTSQSVTSPTSSPNAGIQWYRTSLDKATLARLNARSDLMGWMQTLGNLGILALTGGAVLYGAHHWPIWAVLLALFVHGTCYAFGINAVHEIGHRTVFKTRLLNDIFVRVFSFMSWINFEAFFASHVRHHQNTLHPSHDLEVVLPLKVVLKQCYQYGIVNPMGIVYVLKHTWRIARGKFEGEWETRLFPADQPEKGRPAIMWARTLLVGHALILAVSLYFHWWLVPVVTSFAPFYGGWLFFLCNNTQHIGLQDNVPDFRLCCRTFTLNPVVQFLYWHMNFHTEHHMYAAVPCYNLGKLHKAIKHDLPPCPHGLVATWKEITAIQKLQDEDPTYQHIAPLPVAHYQGV